MYPSTILFALAATIGLINAAAIPQSGDPEYDTCIREFGTVFAGAPSPTIIQCAGCAGGAFAVALAEYRADPDNVEAAKDVYNAEMANCNGPADETYNTCVEQYGTIFAGEPSAGPAECTGCAAQAVVAGMAVYDPSPEGVQEAKDAYTTAMAACTATS